MYRIKYQYPQMTGSEKSSFQQPAWKLSQFKIIKNVPTCGNY